MKRDETRKALTLGEFVAGIYDACGKPTATGIVRLALKTHLVEFCGQQRFAISSGLRPGPKDPNTVCELPSTKSTGTANPVRTNPPHRILVVDGDSMVRHLSADVLIRSGYRVDAAEDGAAGWEALQTCNYNLLITEHDLPNLTGVELVRKLHSARMALPVIMATDRPPMEALIPKPALQLAAVLPKPFSSDQLLQTVRAVLRATDPARAPGKSRPNSRTQTPDDGFRL